MTKEEIEQNLSPFFTDTLLLDADVLRPDANLKNDIGLTSMDIVDIRLYVEKNFGWTMTGEDALSLCTLSDLYLAIENHIN